VLRFIKADNDGLGISGARFQVDSPNGLSVTGSSTPIPNDRTRHGYEAGTSPQQHVWRSVTFLLD
jgi:hypothetical protein